MKPGRVEIIVHESRLLAGNPLGDPAVRRVPVWLPPEHDDEPDRRFPVVYVLAGYSGHGRLMVAERTFAESLDRRLDRLHGEKRLAPAIFVMPDCFTRLGGSQYVDSPATGAYASMILDELVPEIDRRFRGDPIRRGVLGKSSGGFGALRLGLLHPEVFHVLASISGDASFEYCYLPDFPTLMTALDAYQGSVAGFLAGFEVKTRTKVSSGDFAAMSVIAMSACYSPDGGAECGFDLPIDWPSGRLRDDVFERWKAFDPVRLLATGTDPRKSRGIHLECGTRDEYRLLPGTRILRELLEAAGAEPSYAEFPDGHMGLDYRYDTVLPWLVDRLART